MAGLQGGGHLPKHRLEAIGLLQLNFDEIVAVAGMVGDGWQSCPRNPALEVVVESDAVLPGHDDHQILRSARFIK